VVVGATVVLGAGDVGGSVGAVPGSSGPHEATATEATRTATSRIDRTERWTCMPDLLVTADLRRTCHPRTAERPDPRTGDVTDQTRSMPMVAPLDTDRILGPHVTVLVGEDGGRYPAGNTVHVAGSDGSLAIDPSLSLVRRGGAPLPVDRVLLTHVHEDHVAGASLFTDVPIAVHTADLLGLHSLDGLMQIYGLPPESSSVLREIVVRDFHYVERSDATGLREGEVVDLGGVTATLVHLPGHTRGHSGFLIEPDGVLVLGDIDLSAFGPYYGDAWSDLDAFESSLRRARGIDVPWYVTFHHRGVIDGVDDFRRRVDEFAAVIGDREHRMVEFLAEPRTLDDLVAHRFVYRPHVQLAWVESAERRSAEQSLVRLVAGGRVVEIEPGRYRSG
jgi:glyoxylase-like metal-dependent hydrolase (beta-lactamase superfamily II)